MRVYPNIYSQRDPSWAGVQLGTTAGATIGAYGCYLTSFAMKAGYYGHVVKPDALNDVFNRRAVYQGGDLLTDDALTKVFGDCQFVKEYDYANVPTDLNLLKQLAADPNNTVGLELDFDHNPNDGIQTHFVEVHEFDGVNLTIYDPWYGSDDNFALHYGTNPAQTIQKFTVYHGSPTQPGTYVDANTFTTLVTKSTQRDNVVVAFNLSKDDLSTGDQALGKIKDLQKDDQQAHQQVDQQTGALTEANTKISALTGQLGTLTKQVSDQSIQIETLQKQAESSTQSQSEYIQLQKDYNSAKIQWNTQETNYKTQITTLTKASYLNASASTLFKKWIQTVLHIQK